MASPLPPASSWEWLVDAALAEDLGAGDVTSRALLPPDLRGSARVEARESLVVAGLDVAKLVFERLGASFAARCADASRAQPGEILAVVQGDACALLSAERTALNFLQRLCGIATQTARFCEAVRGTRAQILDTRKTIPGWRVLEKYAVRCGGGVNHRVGLYDGILIKDNHIAAVGSVTDAVKQARERAPSHLRVQVEVESSADARAALEAGAEMLLVDNQPVEVIAEIVRWVDGRVPVEASGGMRLERVARVAQTGVDRISIGALTHSAPAVDIGLEWNGRSSS
jgi:nicotinate-nucleotide pyrophosphorylase (carboxylating)